MLGVNINLIYYIMAKSSPGAFTLLKGKVGGVVYYKLTDTNNKATQGTRVYNPTVLNPQTERQQFQRAILKTVSNMYASGKVLFDHSFQSKRKGGENAREFRKLNMRMLRAGIIADLGQSKTGNDATYRVCAPGTNMPVINPYIISRGTYDQTLFTLGQDQEQDWGYILPAPVGEETVAEYMTRNNILPGDIYTFVVLNGSTRIIGGADTADFASQFATSFHYLRMIVKTPSEQDAATPASGANYGMFMTGTKDGIPFSLASTLVIEHIYPGIMLSADEVADVNGLALGMIRSREDQDLRSNTTMKVVMTTDYYGITPENILSVWMPGQNSLGNSELILEGGSGNFTAGV